MNEIDFLDQMYVEIRAMFLEWFTCPIVQGYQNGSPLPKDAIVITFITETDLDQLAYSEDEDLTATTSEPFKVITVQTAVKTMMQVDCYGDSGQARARKIATMFKNPYACERLQSCQPLDYRPPKNLQFVNEQQEYEPRWMVEIDMQYNPHYTYRQESTKTIVVETNPL